MAAAGYDIAVCGCGPAGLAAALFLHRGGHRVTIFERFETPQPLGSGLMLQPTGLAVLARLGLDQDILALGHRVDRMFGRALGSGRTVLDVSYGALGAERYALAVHRAALFGTLFTAAQRDGIALEGRVEIADLERVSEGRPLLVDIKGLRRGPFDLVIDALGARSPLTQYAHGRLTTRPLRYGALWVSLPWLDGVFARHTLEQRYDRASVMIGVLPIGRHAGSAAEQTAFFWSLRSADYDSWRAAGLARWKDAVLRAWPETESLLAPITHADDLTLARYGHHTLARPYGDRIAFVGDVAHATSPQLGQGANMALLDALALAQGLAAEPDLAGALAGYAARRRLHVRLYQAMSRIFTPFYQSDSIALPFIRDSLFVPMTRLPGVPRLLASLVGGAWGLGHGLLADGFGFGAQTATQVAQIPRR
jgi:2-polyprenyl-6-methoxyphenol hydroxylase-like FAD-dependent oxidoreductase